MKKNKSQKNKTIDFPLEEAGAYLEKCVRLDNETSVPADKIQDSIITGDLFDIIPKLPHNFADLLIADPPYNIEKNFNGSQFHPMSFDDYASYTEKWISIVEPILKPKASIYICCDWKSSAAIEYVLSRHFTVRNRITWQREKGRGAKQNWKNSMEDIWFAVKNPHDYYFDVESVKLKRRVLAPYKQNGIPKDWDENEDGKFRLTYPSNFWDDISVPFWSMPENTDHPTQKPEKLYAKLILASSREQGIVFDPFVGSGTASVTAKKLNRHFCGIELNEEYSLLAQKRINLADSNKSIQGYSDGVFYERNSFQQQGK